jgi:uncharacterized protein YkwD
MMFHVKQFLLLSLLLPSFVFSQHMGVSSFEVKRMPALPSIAAHLLDHIAQFPEASQLSAQQKQWFYWTNYSRENPRRFWDSVVAPLIATFPSLNNSYSASLKKELYSAPSLPLLKPNTVLAKAAFRLSRELADHKAPPSHTSPSGATFAIRMKEADIKLCAGENISFGPDNTAFMLVLLYIDEGVPEMGHRKTLLNPAFVEMGVGISSYPDNKVMVVQDFACLQK